MAFCVGSTALSGNTVLCVPGSGTCSAPSIDPTLCDAVVMTGAEYQTTLGIGQAWTYDQSAVDLMFGGALLLWVTGFGIGLVISIVRKARAP